MPTTKSATASTPKPTTNHRLAWSSARSPRPQRALRALAGAAVTVLSLAVSAACSGRQGTTRAAAELPHGQYVALGDSYSAGLGIPDQSGVPAGCGRSSRSYPVLVARSLRLKADQLRDMSCGGATIADLSVQQHTSGGTNLAQLSAVSQATTLVTIGISGNDIGFAPALTRCVELDVVPALLTSGATDLAPCRQYYTIDGVDEIQQKIQAAGERLATALDQIRNRAPHARVYVVGYPDLVPATARATCARTLAITQGDLTFLNDEELRLNSMLHEHAEAAGAAYVDTYTPSVGHDACADPASRWMEPLLPVAPAEPMHPNAAGEQAMAAVIIRAITT